jgi:hypothetical protein
VKTIREIIKSDNQKLLIKELNKHTYKDYELTEMLIYSYETSSLECYIHLLAQPKADTSKLIDKIFNRNNQ